MFQNFKTGLENSDEKIEESKDPNAPIKTSQISPPSSESSSHNSSQNSDEEREERET